MEIRVDNVFKSYRNDIGKINREVLTGLSLTIGSGEKIAIMGPSGSGKTTLLNIIGTLDRPDSGEVVIGNHNLLDLGMNDVLLFRNKNLGFIFQFHHLLPQCTLMENVLLPTLASGSGVSAVTSKRAADLLNLLGIWEQRFNKPGELSGGECQRAAVARALINQPGLILADEPTGSLDASNAESLMKMLVNINRDLKVTMVVVSHSMDVARQMDQAYKIANGKLELIR